MIIHHCRRVTLAVLHRRKSLITFIIFSITRNSSSSPFPQISQPLIGMCGSVSRGVGAVIHALTLLAIRLDRRVDHYLSETCGTL